MKALLTLLLFLVPASAGAANPTELFQQSFTLETAGSYAAALDRMDRLQGSGEDGYLLHLRRGWLLYLNGRYADSVEAYRKAVAAAERSAEARVGLSLPLMALHRWADAEQVCRELLAIAPGNYTGMSRLAWILFSSGRYADAEQAYREVLVQYPSDNDLRSGLGWSLLRQGRTKEARAAFDEVLQVVPGHVSAGQGIAALD